MKLLDHLEEWIITLLMGGATAIIFAAVVHRYLAGLSIPGLQDWLLSLNFSWAQELCIIMFVWMAKFGAAYGVRTGIHVGVDVLINRLSDGMRGASSSSGCWPARCSPASLPPGRPFRVGERCPLRLPDLHWRGSRRHSRRPDHARPRMADLDRL
jgi:hypothetical protein